MREIKTKFGPLFIEEYAFDHHIPGQREEEDRIKIFDSEKRYLDYFMVEYLEEAAEINGHSPEKELQLYIDHLERCNTIEDLVDNSVAEGYEFITTDWKKVAEYFDAEKYTTEESLLDNEWVNKIGNYYVVVSEY